MGILISKYANKNINKCKTKNCKNKRYLDDKCVYCYHVHYISIIENENIIINKKYCPYCIKSAIKNKFDTNQNIDRDCCDNHNLYYDKIKHKINIIYDL
jgi:hypothetical protein